MVVEKIIGVYGAELYEQNAIRFISELKNYGIAHGYRTIAFSTNTNSVLGNNNIQSELQILELFRHINFSCLVILTETLKEPALINGVVAIGREKNIPVFSIDGRVYGCYNMPMDYAQGFEEMVTHVVRNHGARCLNMLAGYEGNAFSEERIAIFKKVLEKYEIPFEKERLGYGGFWERPARAAMEEFMDSGLSIPDAIICANDAMAVTACTVLMERGYQVPEDVIVTGFDGIKESHYHYPQITTCIPNYEASMRFIFCEIEKYKESGKVSPCDYMIQFGVARRQSCGCVVKSFSSQNRAITNLLESVKDSSWHTDAMNRLVTGVLEKHKIEDVVELLPEMLRLWNEEFRLICVKSEMMASNEKENEYREMSDSFGNMTAIFRSQNQEFYMEPESFDVSEFMPRFKEYYENNTTDKTLIVRLLSFGKMVYGYIIEGFDELNARQIQRDNEFVMFLSQSINTVRHNKKLYVLNASLAKANQEIAEMSICDPMTGILNRRGFNQTFNNLLKMGDGEEKYLYIVSVDMDGLKYINDNYGHAEGDFAIISIAKALTKIDAKDMICSRFGGDEFTCAFLADSDEAYTKEGIAIQIKAALDNTPGIKDKPYPVGVSVGLECRKVDENLNFENMMSAADKGMYEDKAKRKAEK